MATTLPRNARQDIIKAVDHAVLPHILRIIGTIRNAPGTGNMVVRFPRRRQANGN